MSATGEPRRPGRTSATARSAIRGEAGDTLIEALVVVAIVALVAAVGFPEMRQTLLTMSRRQTAASVAARLREARAEAQRRDAPVAFAVGGQGRRYGAGGGRWYWAPPGVVLSSPAATRGGIVFQGDGSSAGGWVRVTAGPGAALVTVTAGAGVVALSGS